MSLICIIGGLGYIGSHITIRFLSRGLSVLIIDREQPSILSSIRSRYPLVLFEQCELTDSASVLSIFSRFHISTVIYTLRESFSKYSNLTNCYRNVLIYTNLIDAFRVCTPPLRQLLICSNTNIYVSETENISIEHPYSFFVYLKEKIFYDFALTQSDLFFSILRVSIPIGCDPLFFDRLREKKYLEDHSSLQNNIIRFFLFGDPLTISLYPQTIDCSEHINMVSVNDVGEAFLCCYLSSSQKRYQYYNIANSVVYTVFQFLRHLQNDNKNKDIHNPIHFSTKAYPSILKSPCKVYNINKAQQIGWKPSTYVVSELSALIEKLLNPPKQSGRYQEYVSMYFPDDFIKPTP